MAKNGKEVFVGDILKVRTDLSNNGYQIGELVYKDLSYIVKIKENEIQADYIVMENFNNTEVIGNIHEGEIKNG